MLIDKMAAPSEESFREIANLPNLRILWQTESKDPEETLKYVIYRSSRPDLLNEEGVSAFEKLEIKNILDFRSKKEYSKASGKKLLDDIYPLHKVNFPHGRNYRPGEPVNLKRVIKRDYLFYSKYFSTKQIVTQKTGDDKMKNKQNVGSHILIDFFSAKYIWTVFKRAPWYLQLYSLIFLAIDIMFNTGYVYFVRFFARNVLNPTGLIGQYKDMIDMSQRSICSALKLLSDKENYPVFINCAHGKDRTGLVSALVLSCLQLPKLYVSKEYGLSRYGTTSMRDRLYTEIVKRFHMSEEFVTAEADTMMKLLEYICEMYGSIENYLECIGFGEKEQENLRNIFGRQKISETQ